MGSTQQDGTPRIRQRVEQDTVDNGGQNGRCAYPGGLLSLLKESG